MIHHAFEQGSPEWLAVRRGCITGSRFKDARDMSDGLTEQQRKFVEAMKKGCTQGEAMMVAGYKAAPRAEAVNDALAGRSVMAWSAAAIQYAMDTARERCGGTVPQKFQNAAMKTGQVQEPEARMAYEAHTGNLVQEVGFITTDDGLFGLSPDGLIDADGVLEVKTMVSSDTLFKAVAAGDLSEYLDQCNGYLWLLGRQWVDLVLWAPDLAHLGLALTIHRITRDETAIEALESDLLKFAALVKQYEGSLRAAALRTNNLQGIAA